MIGHPGPMPGARCYRCRSIDCAGQDCAPTHCEHGVEYGDGCPACDPDDFSLDAFTDIPEANAA